MKMQCFVAVSKWESLDAKLKMRIEQSSQDVIRKPLALIEKFWKKSEIFAVHRKTTLTCVTWSTLRPPLHETCEKYF
jgi:hypothetical protein